MAKELAIGLDVSSISNQSLMFTFELKPLVKVLTTFSLELRVK